jgi:hypothetical protein
MRLMFNSAGRLGLLFLGFSITAHADPAADQAHFYESYFKVASVQTKVISVEEDVGPNAELTTSALRSKINHPETTGVVPFVQDLSGLLSGGSSGLAIADVALKIWDIIEQNKAVANVEMAGTSALPKIANQNWQVMTGWKPERSVRFSLEIKNLFGMKVVELQYDVHLIYGGSVNGKGLYVASARVLPSNVSVLWGYNLDVNVNVASVYNVGTAQNPVAAIDLDVQYK